MEERTNAARAEVHGRVQGVAFRHFTRQRAEELDLVGWVRNRRDGRVELFAEGTREALAELREWLSDGPPAARVERVDWSAAERGSCLRGFEIRPTS